MVMCQRSVNDTVTELQFVHRVVGHISQSDGFPTRHSGLKLLPLDPFLNDMRKNHMTITASTSHLGPI